MLPRAQTGGMRPNMDSCRAGILLVRAPDYDYSGKRVKWASFVAVHCTGGQTGRHPEPRCDVAAEVTFSLFRVQAAESDETRYSSPFNLGNFP